MISQLIREAFASARSQPVASTITIIMVAGMIFAVMLTTGRTVGAEQSVLSSIDSAGTRSILIRADDAAGVTSDVLDRIAGIDGIEWAGAFSSAIDATNGANLDGTRVPVRYAYGSDFARIGISDDRVLPGQVAYASQTALDQFGLIDIVGSITLTTGNNFAVVGRIDVPEFLSDFEPLVLLPKPDATGSEPINVIVIIADRPDLVTPVSNAVLSVLGANDPTGVTVQTSAALAELRALIEGQLGSVSRGLVLALLGITGTLVAILLYGLVMMRRKDFGRRRALGATRSYIVALLLTQTALLAIAGITIGTVGSVIALITFGDPLPGVAFATALALLAFATALVAALLPALVASRREPIRELRVP